MRYKRFGKTDMQVSEMCLGTWGIGGVGWDSNSDETRMDAIYAALEAGINFIDTAPAYNGGEAERLLGRASSTAGRSSLNCSTDPPAAGLGSFGFFSFFFPLGFRGNTCTRKGPTLILTKKPF